MKAHTKRVIPLIGALILLMTCSTSQRGIIILCLGDSLTDSSYPRHLFKIFQSEGIRARVLNRGQKGNTSGEYLDYLKNEMDVLYEEHPDFILIQLGTNDVRFDHDQTSKEQFFANLKGILDILKPFQNPDGKKSRAILATIPPIPQGMPFPFTPQSQIRVVTEINPLILKLADEEDIPVVDNFSLFVQNPHLLPEVHPNEEGYRRLARNWFETIQPLLK